MLISLFPGRTFYVMAVIEDETIWLCKHLSIWPCAVGDMYNGTCVLWTPLRPTKMPRLSGCSASPGHLI